MAIYFHERIVTQDADLETQGEDRGVILESPSGYRFLLQVDDSGVLSTVQISASPEVDMDERRARKAAKHAEEEQDRVDFDSAGQLQDKVNVIAEHVGLKDRE